MDNGLNVIDTAECYVNSEELIGKAVSHRRKEFYLFTKCGHASGLDLDDIDKGGWEADAIIKSIDRSLKNLRTDYLDLIQLHSCTRKVLKEGSAIEGLQKARAAGKVRYIGYSGDGEDAKYAIETGAFDSLQTSISIADQQSTNLTVPLAKKAKMGIIAKRPIANAIWRNGKAPSKSDYARPYWDRLQELDYSFINGNLDKSISIALRFTLGVPGVCTAIVGTSNPDRWTANAKILEEGPLDQATLDEIASKWKDCADKSWVGQV
jgi:aryl-alcohol dehydrogenase-like predicted oxidoreductase